MEFHSQFVKKKKKMTSRAGAHRKPREQKKINAKHKVVNRMVKPETTFEMIAKEMKEFNE